MYVQKNNTSAEHTANNWLERRIVVSDNNDPHVILENLDEKWADATEDTEAAWHALMANPLDHALRDEYFDKQHLSIKAGQTILEHKHATGM
jgi:hypothetical protein